MNRQCLCAADYREWEVQRREKVTADNTYRPSSAQFEGISHYQTDYIPHPGAPRHSMKPQEAAKVSEQPFEDATDYKQSYVKYALPPREVREKTVWQPNTAKLDDMSIHRRDYTPKVRRAPDALQVGRLQVRPRYAVLLTPSTWVDYRYAQGTPCS